MHVATAAALVEKVADWAADDAQSAISATQFEHVRSEAAHVRSEAALLADAGVLAQETLDVAYEPAPGGLGAEHETQRGLAEAARSATQVTTLASKVVDLINSIIFTCQQSRVWNVGVAACSAASAVDAAFVTLHAFRRLISDPAEREMLNQAADDMRELADAARTLARTAMDRSRV